MTWKSKWKTSVIALIFLVMICTSGCVTVTGVCPRYPDPPMEAIDVMFEANNPALDGWLQDLERLREQLELCR